jgi:hypothetical protein
MVPAPTRSSDAGLGRSVDVSIVGLLRQHPLSVTICALACAIVAGAFLFARPEYRPAHQGKTIKIPFKQPARDAAGRQGWVWPDGVPGWEAGFTISGYNISQLQAVEVEPARLTAAHMELDADQVRVLTAMHVLPGDGPLAIFAAPLLYEAQHTVCLGAALPRTASVAWLCPGASHPGPDVARSHVLVAAAAYDWSSPSTPGSIGLDLVGVARGDVYRVVLHIPGQRSPKAMPDQPLYARGKTWGQFDAAFIVPRGAGASELRIYGRGGLVQTVRLSLNPGDERIVQR